MEDAALAPGPHSIVFDAGLTPGATIALQSALPVIDFDLVIDGSALEGLTISGNGQHRVFRIGDGANDVSVTLRDLNIADGLSQGSAGGSTGGGGGGGGGAGLGGGVFVDSQVNLVLEDVRFTGNEAVGGAGGSVGSRDPYNGGVGGTLDGVGTGASGGADGGAGTGGAGGFGGGDGGRGGQAGALSNHAGNGGSGYGAAVFVREGATISVVNGDFDANTVTAGSGRLSGAAAGSDLYLMDGTLTYAVDAGQVATLNGDIAGGTGTGLRMNGPGTLALMGNNAYGGGTELNAGVLQLGHSNGLGSGTLTADGGALSLANGLTVGNAIALDQDLSVQVVADGSASLIGTISGAGGLSIDGPGTLTLTGSNTYLGGTSLNGGTLHLGSNNAIGNGTVRADGGALSLADAVTISNQIVLDEDLSVRVDAGGTASLTGVISSARGLALDGAGTLVLSSENTYTGGTALNTGTLQLGHSNGLGSGVLTAGGGALSLANGLTVGNAIALDQDMSVQVAAGDGTSLAGTISGAGGLSIDGPGTLTLTGNNTYQGGTSLNAGALHLGNNNAIGNGSLRAGGGALSLANALALSNQIVLDEDLSVLVGAGGTASLTGAISGTQGLALDGAGTLVLSSENTYTGGTTLNAGTLQLGHSNALGSGVLTATGGTFALTDSLSIGNALALDQDLTVLVDTDDSASVTGNISGDQGLVLNGNGALLLSGNNSYAGGTALNAGTLQLGHSNALGTGALTADGGTLALTDGLAFGNAVILDQDLAVLVDTDDLAALTGNISGNQGLVLNGNGTLLLSGDNNYAGGTALNAGMLQLGHSNALGSGALTAGGGALFLADGLALSNQIALDEDLSVLVDGGDSAELGGELSGTERLILGGPGRLVVSGDSMTFAGQSEVRNGELSVAGSLGGSTVVSGGTLSGTGRLANLTVGAGGVLAPGNSIGTLTVDSVDFSGGGVYAVEVNADGRSDRLVVTGNANLTQGRVSVLPEAGDYANVTEYTIIDAGSITGTFDSVSVDLPAFAYLDASLGYSATRVSLQLARNDTDFASVANTPNALNTANALSQASGSGRLSQITNELMILDADGAQRAFESLSGNQLSQGSTLAISASQRFGSLLSSRSQVLSANPGVVGNFAAADSREALAKLNSGNLASLSEAPAATAAQTFMGGSGFWLTPQAGFGDIDSSRNARGTDYRYGGLSAGYDDWYRESLLLGVSLSYSETRADDIDMDSVQASLYGRLLLNNQRYLDASIMLGRHQVDSERVIVVGNNVSSAEGDYAIDSRSASLEFGQAFSVDDALTLTLTPFVGVQYTHLDRESFTEKSAGEASLRVESDRQESLRSSAGLRAATQIVGQSGRLWNIDGSVAWVHEYADNTATTNSAFAGAPEFTFKTAGVALDRDRARVGLGVTTQLFDNGSLRIGYQGELSSTDRDHSAFATFSFNW